MKAQGVRCGVVGVGSLGQHHARIYEALPQSQLVGIYDLDQRRAAEIAGKHNCRAFPSLEELGRACDAVSVVVPTKAHEVDGAAAARERLPSPDREAAVHEPRGGRARARRRERQQSPRASRPHRAFQPGDELPREAGERPEIHHHRAARALLHARHRRRRRARPHDPRHRHRHGARQIAAATHRQPRHQRPRRRPRTSPMRGSNSRAAASRTSTPAASA